MMTRLELQRLSQAKVDDAQLLCTNGRYGNAYYLAGYAVELGLKACVAKQIREHQIPDKALINGIYTHEAPKLIGLAGLSGALKEQQDRDGLFQSYWAICAEWKPDARYVMNDAMSAELLLTAVGDPEHGVLQWIKAHW
jgi:hypothetical protein